MGKELIIKTLIDNILIIQFNHEHQHNPFSDDLKDAVTEALLMAENDNNVKGVVLTGGIGRSFTVGGDFNETSTFEGGTEVIAWIERIINLYISCLSLSKPSIAAVDKYAIGLGFQLAITCDVRIGSDRCQFIMPELKHGIACSVGQYMLEKTFGRAFMQKIIYGCDPLDHQQCVDSGVLSSYTKPECLIQEAVAIAKKMSDYPQVAFSSTKRAVNAQYIEELRKNCEISKKVHMESFSDGHAQKFMAKIINKNQA